MEKGRRPIVAVMSLEVCVEVLRNPTLSAARRIPCSDLYAVSLAMADASYGRRRELLVNNHTLSHTSSDSQSHRRTI